MGRAWLLVGTEDVPSAPVQTRVRTVFSHRSLGIRRGTITMLKLQNVWHEDC